MNDKASKTKGLAWLCAACLLGAGMGLGLSPIARAVPWSWERKLAMVIDSDSTAQECPGNAKARALLQRLVTRLYPVYPEDSLFTVDVRIVSSPVVNAYAGLGGRISVNSGLLKQAQSPEELAGVLAHEMEHVRERHILQGVISHALTVQGLNMIFSGGASPTATWANYFLHMSFTRSQESQADEGGLHRLQKAHIDNQGFRHFFERMEQSDLATLFLSDHPSNAERIERVDTFDNQNVTPIMTAPEWKTLKNYCDHF